MANSFNREEGKQVRIEPPYSSAFLVAFEGQCFVRKTSIEQSSFVSIKNVFGFVVFKNCRQKHGKPFRRHVAGNLTNLTTNILIHNTFLPLNRSSQPGLDLKAMPNSLASASAFAIKMGPEIEHSVPLPA